jgi:RHS repeat-associated protein/CSLREA domain-containing protein
MTLVGDSWRIAWFRWETTTPAGVPVLDRFVWSGLRPKNGSGDPRECPTTACGNTQGYTGDPINTRTGGFDYAWADLSLPTTAGPLVFQRTYASPVTDTYTTTLGYGWTHNQDTRLIFPADPGGETGAVWFKAHSANQYRFTDNGDNTYTPYNGVLASLTASTTPTTTYTLTNSAQAVYTFDYAGRLTAWKDSEGHQFSYLYDLTSGHLLTVTEPISQRYLSFQYTDPQNPNRLTSVRDHTGRHMDFGYSAAGDLTSVTDVLGQTWTYTYDAAHQLTEVRDPNDAAIPSLRVEYDSATGRAVRQYDGLNRLMVEATYTGSTATITNTLGITETHVYNGLNTLTNDNGPLGSALGKAYDVNFRPAVITDSLNHPTTLTWSADGANLAQVTDTLNQTTQLDYDSFNNLTQVVDTRGFTSTFTYSGTLLTASTDALGQATFYTYTTAADAPQPPNLIKAVTDALGRATSYQYDALGQTVRVTDTAGIVTTYGYDDLGRVVTTTLNLGTSLQQVSVNQYDAAGRVKQVTRNYLAGQPQNYLSRYNLITRYGYDAVGNQTVMTDTVGRVTQNVYDDNHRLIQTTGNVWPGQPQNYLNQYNLITAYGYNDLGLQEWMTDTVGRVTRTEYDALNRPATTTTNYVDGNFNPAAPDEDLRTVTQYDANGNVVMTTQFAGVAGLERTTHIQYDPLNRPVTVTANYVDGSFNGAEPDRDIQSVTQYDANGNVVSVTEYANVSGLARTTLTEYDPLNRPISTTVNYAPGAGGADKNITSLTEYNAIGAVVTTTEFAFTNLARVTLAGYDASGRPVTTTANFAGSGAFDPNFPDRNLTQITTYGAAGERAATTELRGGPAAGGVTPITTTYGYDNLGRLITTTWPLTGTAVASTTVTYDALSRVVESVDPLGQKTRTEYDALDRPITATVNYKDGVFDFTRPDEDLVTVNAYDAAGNLTQVKDPKGVVTKFEYDRLGWLTAVVENYVSGGSTDPQTNVRTEYTYDAAGNLKTITDGRGKVTTFGYDLLNRQVTASDPLTHVTQYEYDAAGNRVRLTDANGQVITFTYDLLNRLTGIDYPAPDADVTFTYDSAGQRTAMTDGLDVTTWGYDGVGRPLTITQPIVGSVLYGYDSAGNRTSLTYPDGKVVTYTYDLNSRLVLVKDWLAQMAGYAYDPASRLTTLTLPNGITTTYTYDGANRLSVLTHQTMTQTLASYAYTVDAAGNRVQAVENIQPPSPVVSGSGSTITVNTFTDELNTDGDCSLREAVRAANLNSAVDACPAGSASSPDTILLSAGTYTLTVSGSGDTAGDIDLTSSMTFVGAGISQTVISGGSSFANRIFEVFTATVQIDALTIQNGNVSAQGGGLYIGAGGVVTLTNSAVYSNTAIGSSGGGLYNKGALALVNSTVISNTGSYGGGLYNNGGAVTLTQSTVSDNRGTGGGLYNSDGTLTLVQSAVLNNATTATNSSGGGLYNYGGAVTLTNTTVSGNRATKNGGGIVSFNSALTATVTLNNVTLTNNTADSEGDGTGDGGGILRSSSIATVRNTLIAGNFDNSPSTKYPDCSGTYTSQGYNLIGNNAGCSGFTNGVNGDQVGTSGSPIGPKLSALQDNGGPTWTHALLFSSPAIDTGNPATPGSGGNACETSDQRNFARPADGNGDGSARCDIGAYEASLPTGNIRVTTTTDEFNTDGDCSLREAIRAATLNAAVDACPAGSASSVDTIIVPAGTYTLTLNGSTDTTGDLDLTSPMTLQGAGANLTIIAAGSGFTDRLVHVLNTTAQLNGLTLRGANTATQGAGLYNQGGTVTLAHSALVSNTTSSTGGGGAYNTGTLTLRNSAVLSNTTTGTNVSGGGLYNWSGTVTVLNSTISGNRASKGGGGIASFYGSLTLANVTVTNNTADTNNDNSGDGGGVYRSSTTAILRNSLIAGNADNTSSGTKYPDCTGTFTSQGYNLIQNTTGCTITGNTTGNITGQSAQLGPLSANGGPTLTHAPLAGSPAIDTGSPSPLGSGGNACEVTDQRRYGRSADGDANGAARCDIGAYEVGAAPVAVIAYAYDPLYRLTAANYSNGLAFNYTYDAVGNRLTQTTLAATTVYTYDDANRLVNVGGVNYTWDNNGNLLSDGVSTYAYDSANRLTSVAQGANTYTFAYNGLDDRLRQTVNGNATTYVLDLNAGLTQVLADGTNTYLYGNGRIAQYVGTTPAYFLSDALGSVRQLTNSAAQVTLARSHEPYGSVLSSAGTGTTSYAFAGEWHDSYIKLLHLRARYYSLSQGRFLTRDPFPGVYTRPASLHPYQYGYNNPILYTDPSGKIPPIPPTPIICPFGRDPETGACKGIPWLPPVFTTFLQPAFTPQQALVGLGVLGLCVLAAGVTYVVTQSQARPVTWGDILILPQPEPTKVIVPRPVSQPTATPEPEKDISLGLSSVNGQPALRNFTEKLNAVLNPQNTYVYMFDQWYAAGLSDTNDWTSPTGFSLMFDQAVSRAGRIHFNLEGIGRRNIRFYIEQYGGKGDFTQATYITAAELYRIRHHGWCYKTSFYTDGSVTPSETVGREICEY